MSVRFRFVNDVRQQRQDAVADRVPEVQHAVRIAADEPRPEDHVRLAVENRPSQLRELRRVVLQVGILHDDHVAGRSGEAGPERRALPAVPLVPHHHHVVEPCQIAQRVGACRRSSSRRR